MMTESLWNKYDISRNSQEIPVKWSPKVFRNERTLEMNAPWDSIVITVVIIIANKTANINVQKRSLYAS